MPEDQRVVEHKVETISSSGTIEDVKWAMDQAVAAGASETAEVGIHTYNGVTRITVTWRNHGY